MVFDPNSILKIYLGAGKTGGYTPYGDKERMLAAFSTQAESLQGRIQKYLDAVPTSPKSFGNLAREQKVFEAELAQRFPELDAVAIHALACAWSYSWR